MSTEPAVKTLSSRVVYRNEWMTLREDGVERLDGSRGVYSFVERSDFAVVIPLDDNGFHLVEQYRYPAQRRSWEFPQGGWPHGRGGTPEQLAAAELAEETGFTADELAHLGRLSCANGTLRQSYDVYLATGLTPGEPRREIEEQDMRLQWFSRADVEAMIADGVITDDSTLAADLLLSLHRRWLG
ncbi:MAG: NUDIX hydrolase [Mycobacteriaceae bacterium]|nr:NUDIX hydrolase [Mycobacteriaceae bacterium]